MIAKKEKKKNDNNNRSKEVSYFQLPKDTSIHKDWIHGTGSSVDNLPSKIENIQTFLNSYSKEQTEHVYCPSFEFLHNILC